MAYSRMGYVSYPLPEDDTFIVYRRLEHTYFATLVIVRIGEEFRIHIGMNLWAGPCLAKVCQELKTYIEDRFNADSRDYFKVVLNYLQAVYHIPERCGPSCLKHNPDGNF